jgi:acido-empty-quinoprotein group A
MNMRSLALFAIAALAAIPLALVAQTSLDPASLNQPPTDSWPTYHGDYSGRHFSPLKQITTLNAKNLSLAWMFHTTASTENAIIGGAAAAPTPGRGPAAPAAGGPTIKSIPLMVNGNLYLTAPNHTWAVDARTGQLLWHYVWQGRGVIGNRGVGIYGNWLYFETGDNSVVSVDALSGKERWRQRIAPEGASNFSTSAPLIIRNHVILGVGGDSGRNADWIESRDPETGELQWQWNVTPSAGEPGIDTWPSPESAAIGAGGPWQPGTYDPELNLVYIPTGNPTPSYNGRVREGANLYTCSLIAMNPDTGKVAWYYQFSPHDTHDWDATETPVLIDGTIDGRPRKLVALAQRNGYYFLLDRTNGKSLLIKKFVTTANAYVGTDANGVLIPSKEKEPSPGGSLVSPTSDGATNYPSPSFDPLTGLFYTNATTDFSIFYLPPDANAPSGYGRGGEWHTGEFRTALKAIDYKTGEVKWEHNYDQDGFAGGTYPGALTTAGGVLFTGDPSGNFIAFDAATGKILWHCPLGNAMQSNTPETFMLDGHQYVLVGGGDTLFAFYLQ